MGLGKTIKKAYMKGKKKAYGSKGVKGRYIRPGFTKGMGNLIKDVEMIKSRLNVEKKHNEVDVSTFNIGQVDVNADGYGIQDVTPFMSRGTTSSQRIGDSLKLTGMSFPISFTGQQQCLGGRRVRITLLRVTSADNGVSTTGAISQVWDQNPLTGVLDYNAPRRYRNSKTDGITVVRSMTCYIKAPSVDANGSLQDSEANVKTIRFSVKADQLLRFDENVHPSLPVGIKYFLVFQCDSGNRGTGTTSTLDVPVKSGSTGLTVRLAQRFWWVDN